jgi:hypothetical protein
MGLGGLVKKFFKPVKLKKRDFDPEKVSIEDVRLPKILNSLGNDIIFAMMKEEISTYKSLGYHDKTLETLERKTYHSFQIGTMLRFIQSRLDILVVDTNKIFPSMITMLSFDSLQLKVFNIIGLYDKKIKKDLSGTQLINDIEWTPLDAGYLLYYIVQYKKN